MDKYREGFPDWNTVMTEFSEGYEENNINMPEPEGLIWASYTYEGYEGDANVLWRNEDGTFGYVNGSHCSCYGLEGQWNVEEYTKETLLGQFDRTLDSGYPYGFFNNKELRDLVASL